MGVPGVDGMKMYEVTTWNRTKVQGTLGLDFLQRIKYD